MSGTPIRVVLGVVCSLVLVLASAAAARASSGLVYHVLKCHPGHPTADEVSELGNHSSYQRIDECGPGFGDPKFGIYNLGAAPNNAFEQSMYVAPAATVLRRVCLQHKLRRQSHHRAELLTYPGYNVLASGGDEPGGWSGTQCFQLNTEALIVRLACSQAGGCPAGPNAHAYVRNLDIEIEDLSDPVITNFGGSLLQGGWIRGSASVVVNGNDFGAGVSTLGLEVDGVEVTRQPIACPGPVSPGWPYAGTLIPCPATPAPLITTVDTRESAFRNGQNTVTAWALDYPANTAVQQRTVFVDNDAPVLAFATTQDPDDPELIHAPVADAHSGVRAVEISYRMVGGSAWTPLETNIEDGEARARVDSSSMPTGDYEFKAESSDVAGNSRATTLRQNGTPMRLHFPLRFASRIEAGLGHGASRRQTVRYGRSSTVSGRLVDSAGEPLSRQQVVVLEDFGPGALIRQRPTYVETDSEGRFRSKVPAGPSRQITVEFAGTQRYRPDQRSAGSFQVRSRASFRTSRDELTEGQRLVFGGRVAHHGARIPSGGKLIELQVRVGPRQWDTVREAFRTDDSGRYRLGYRFGRHYTSDATFRFRVKVQDEGDWPFEGSISRQRRVVVHAR